VLELRHAVLLPFGRQLLQLLGSSEEEQLKASYTGWGVLPCLDWFSGPN
jgi:hypothetical protein